MTHINYWTECIQSACEEAGLHASDEQIASISEAVMVSHENYGLFTGQQCIPNPLATENAKLTAALLAEKDAHPCPVCHGEGRLLSKSNPYRKNDGRGTCEACGGRGKV